MTSFRRGFLELARVVLGLYLLGNITYPLSKWLWSRFGQFGPLHAELGATVLQAAIDLAALLVLFARDLAISRVHRGDACRSIFVGVGIAAGLVAVMVAGYAFGIASWHLHEPRALQWIYLIGFSAHAAISEELMCRYLVLDRLGRIIGTPPAFLLQILLFIYLHMFGPPIGLMTLTWLAAGATLFGSFHLWRRSLPGVMALHFTYDLLAGLTFGGAKDGLVIPPQLVGDNFSQRYATLAGVFFMLALSVWMRTGHPMCATLRASPTRS